MKIQEVKTWKFNELPEEVKAKAIENYQHINVDFAWWDNVYMDAENIGLKINSFDIDRGQNIDMEFTDDASFTAAQIKKEHGDQTNTYKLAAIWDEHSHKGYDQWTVDTEFLTSLRHEYLFMLSQEYDYLTSDEAIAEILESNDYDFTEDGRIF